VEQGVGLKEKALLRWGFPTADGINVGKQLWISQHTYMGKEAEFFFFEEADYQIDHARNLKKKKNNYSKKRRGPPKIAQTTHTATTK